MKSTHLLGGKDTTRCTKDARKLLIAAKGVAPTCKICLLGTSYPQPSPLDEQTIKTTWAAFQVADTQLNKRGLAFGKALYEYRAGCEVVQGGTTFNSLLAKLKIPHSTAYVWIEKYAVSIGMKKLNKEKHQHRGEGNFDQIKTDALEIVKLGHQALLDKGKAPHPTQAAKAWAYARLKSENFGPPSSSIALFTQAEMDAEYERGYADGLKAGRECGTNANVPQTEEGANVLSHQ